MRILFHFLILATLGIRASGQTSEISIRHEEPALQEQSLTNALTSLRESGNTLKPETIHTQLRRASCNLNLPPPANQKLTPRELLNRARTSSLRVGWYYQCTTCDQWRLNLAAGYLLTTDGAACTAYHVVEPPRDIRDGFLVAADNTGKIIPVIEVLAANRYSDACIIRVKGEGFVPLPLSTNAQPGDAVFCLTNPAGQLDHFNQGTVNRFFRLPERRLANEPGAPWFAPTRIDVNIDWSRGSSGAALLDQFGNAIGHVSTISVDDKQSPTHTAASAHDVLALIRKGN